MKTINTLFISGLLLLSTATFAADEAERSGISLAVGGSYIMENFDTAGTGLAFDPSSGFNLKAAYSIDDNLDIELEVLIINGFDETAVTFGTASLDGNATTISGRWVSPISDNTSIYGLIGLGLASVELSDPTIGFVVSDTGLISRFGGGLSASVGSGISIFGELSYYLTSGDIDGVDFIPLTAGVRFSF